MADGNHQQSGFNFPRPQLSLLRPGEIVVDLFAGGGGASEALKQALGRDPDLAYNHDVLAIGMHAANHPLTQHKREDIWIAQPRREVGLRMVGNSVSPPPLYALARASLDTADIDQREAA